MEYAVLPVEMFGEIARWIENGRTWKSFVWSCKLMYALNTPENVDKFSNHLTTLLTRHPPSEGWEWDVSNLSWNHSLPWSFIKERPPGPDSVWKWDLRGISSNPSLSWD